MLDKRDKKFNIYFLYIFVLALLSVFITFSQHKEINLENLNSIGSCKAYGVNLNINKNLSYSDSQIKNELFIENILTYEKTRVYLEQNYLDSFEEGFNCLGKITDVNYINNNYFIKIGVLDKLFQIIKFGFLSINVVLFYLIKRKNRLFYYIGSSVILSYILNLYLNYDFLFNTDYKYYSPYREILDSLIFSIVVAKIVYKENLNLSKWKLPISKLYNFFIFSYLVRITYMYYSKFQYDDVIQEWFVNYNYGFIRRGLTGSFLINLKIFNEESIQNSFFLFLLIVYFVYLIEVKKILISNQNNLLKLFFIVSPAFLIFNLYWGSSITFPKEIIGFIAYFYFLNNFQKIVNKKYLTYFISILFAISIFSHEINLWILPFMFLVIYFQPKPFKYIMLVILLIAVSLTFLFFLLSSNNNNYISEKICDTTYKQLLPESDCYKSQVLSTSTVSDNIVITADTILFSNNTKYYFSIYLTYFFLGLLPFFLSKWFLDKKFVFLLVFLSFIPLFVIGVDWGRWLNIYFTLAYTTILYFDKSKKQIKNYESKNLVIAFSIIYASIWSIPQCCVTEYSYIYLFNISKFNLTLLVSIFIIFYNFLIKSRRDVNASLFFQKNLN